MRGGNRIGGHAPIGAREVLRAHRRPSEPPEGRYAVARSAAPSPARREATAASNRAVRAKAAAARARRVSRRVPPSIRPRRGAPEYCAGSQTGADSEVVFGGGAKHGRSSDIDALPEFLGGRLRLGRLFDERIQVDDDHVEGDRAETSQVGLVAGISALGEQTEIYLPVERLHEPAFRFGLPRVIAHRNEPVPRGESENGAQGFQGPPVA